MINVSVFQFVRDVGAVELYVSIFESGVVNHRPSSSLPDGLPGTPKMKFEIEGGIAPPPRLPYHTSTTKNADNFF